MSEPADTQLVPPSSVVLVSGGSRGLGLAIVTDLLDAGVRVAAFARTITPELEKLAAEHPDRVHVGSVDVTDLRAAQSFVREVEQRLGPIDGIVNNAAMGQDSLHAHTAADDIARIIETNLTAPLQLTRLVIRRMLAKGLRGRIVNITSICGQRGFPGLVAYSATKGGMDAATRSLARELGGRMLVNSVAPGFFASEMSAVLGPTQLDQIVRRTPTGHLTEPVEVTPVVRMLLREHTNINGQVIVVDGAAAI
ncbi:SDR family NAD(P)-dependent oxidoreductase [Micromonospora sp. NPDC127501]|uniref:3-oxoacyl-[acyl-carrier-protein] reductase n=2 Tax=Micromonospora TaxID=1873 RepID=A0A328N5F2_9ACTN|nr:MULTISPECIES: SDR family NAD(P)-dependent oxidoreductase [Micromonospora]RAN99310.1 3-oxoacyl-[acyl-carrier-protein] reductase [Micromonospora noduli]RAO00346.1 3-oxoacyl-[acyl-carrier-protein] reductase [Micromonospora saelicesensis]RAO36717.1 3-oxoacyl-[acyl-carrier-protein] reductase [Micromonospora noduli]